jgi:glutamine amidotransferase
MENLLRMDLIELLHEQVLEKQKPILGICLGMQLFCKSSEEGALPGLGWIDAETVKFHFEGNGEPLRIPHMGWNTIRTTTTHRLFEDLPENARFYFVHSYHVRCNSQADVLAETTYGVSFHSAVVKGHILGTQFHPEKSHKFGLRLLRNFAEAGL